MYKTLAQYSTDARKNAETIDETEIASRVEMRKSQIAGWSRQIKSLCFVVFGSA